MLGWIEGLFSSATSAISQAVKDLIHVAIRGLYGVLHAIFGNVARAWGDTWRFVRDFFTGELHFVLAAYNAFRRIFKILIPWLSNQITWVYHWAISRIDAVLKWLLGQILYYYHLLLSLMDAVRKWVVNSVWKPLYSWLTTIWHWVTHEGYTVWHYFTHLAEFAELLFWHLIVSLEKHAWDAAALLGKFFLALIIRNVVRFATLMETIIDAVF